jgi:1-acyl-sn-glycerol-3-phosphate acyltransferase
VASWSITAARLEAGARALAFTLVRALARLLVRAFYRRIEVVGLEHVPRTGPVLVVPNHPNALLDSLVVLATVPRRFVPVAAAPQFRLPIYGAVLRLLGGLPAHRRRDQGSDLTRNATTVAGGIEILRRGGALLLFPEGTSQPDPRLLPLKTGAARMALGAEATLRREAAGDARASVTLLPVGLVYDRPATFRTGSVVVQIGAPVCLRDLLAADGTITSDAMSVLTARLREALSALILEAEDRETLELLRVAEACWRDDVGEIDVDGAVRIAWIRQALDVRRRLPPHALARVSRLRTRLARYQGQRARHHRGRATLALAIVSWAPHLVPYALTSLVVCLARPTRDMEATWKVLAGLILYPLAWIVEAWAAWVAAPRWLFALLLVWLIASSFSALVRPDRSTGAWSRARDMVSQWWDPVRMNTLRDERRAIVAELRALAAQVPDPAAE